MWNIDIYKLKCLIKYMINDDLQMLLCKMRKSFWYYRVTLFSDLDDSLFYVKVKLFIYKYSVPMQKVKGLANGDLYDC